VNLRIATIGLICATATAVAGGVAVADPVAGREAIVVLGSGVQPDGTFGARGTARLEKALEVALARPDALVVVSGGAVTSEHQEGPLMASWLIERGVAPGRLRVEPRAMHTGENADFTMPILRDEKVETVSVVTDRAHMARATYHFEAAAAEQGAHGLVVRTVPAEDGLRGQRLFKQVKSERLKIERDKEWRRSRLLSSRGTWNKRTARARAARGSAASRRLRRR
jgi:vancomycin permeability regulator SanA